MQPPSHSQGFSATQGTKNTGMFDTWRNLTRDGKKGLYKGFNPHLCSYSGWVGLQMLLMDEINTTIFSYPFAKEVNVLEYFSN